MLSEKMLPIDYQDYNNLIIEDLNKILDYETNHNLKFDVIIGKLNNEILGANIISNYLGVDLAIIDIPLNGDIDKSNMLFPINVINKLENNVSIINILFVDYMSPTEDTIEKLKRFFNSKYQNINLVIYCTFTMKESSSNVNIEGRHIDKLIQAPWERCAFTPQTHLDRLERWSLNTLIKNSFCIGLCSDLCEEDIKVLLPASSDKVWYMVFQDKTDQLMTSSMISTYIIPDNMTFNQANTKYKTVITEKIEFIKTHGLTHFIETNLAQAVLLSKASPICHIIFYADNVFYNIFVREADKKNIFITK